MLKMKLPGWNTRGTTLGRFMATVEEDLKIFVVSVEERARVTV